MIPCPISIFPTSTVTRPSAPICRKALKSDVASCIPAGFHLDCTIPGPGLTPNITSNPTLVRLTNSRRSMVVANPHPSGTIISWRSGFVTALMRHLPPRSLPRR